MSQPSRYFAFMMSGAIVAGTVFYDDKPHAPHIEPQPFQPAPIRAGMPTVTTSGSASASLTDIERQYLTTF